MELAPNLSGLAEFREDLREGDRVSVYLKSVAPERMKIKLLVIDRLPPLEAPPPLRYYHTEGRLEHWRYAPEAAAGSGVGHGGIENGGPVLGKWTVCARQTGKMRRPPGPRQKPETGSFLMGSASGKRIDRKRR